NLAGEDVQAGRFEDDPHLIVIIQAARVKRHSHRSDGEDEAGYDMDGVGFAVLKTDFHSGRRHRQRLGSGDRAGYIPEPASGIVSAQKGDGIVVGLSCEREQHDQHRQHRHDSNGWPQTVVKRLDLHRFGLRIHLRKWFWGFYQWRGRLDLHGNYNLLNREVRAFSWPVRFSEMGRGGACTSVLHLVGSWRLTVFAT